MDNSQLSLSGVFNQALLVILLSSYGSEPVPPVRAHTLTNNAGNPLPDNPGHPLTDNGL